MNKEAVKKIMIFKFAFLFAIRYITFCRSVCKTWLSKMENSAILSVSQQFNLQKYPVETEIKPLDMVAARQTGIR